MMYAGRRGQIEQLLRFLQERHALHVFLPEEAFAALERLGAGEPTGIPFLDAEDAERERADFSAQVSQATGEGLILVFLNVPNDADLQGALPRVACNYADIIRYLSDDEMDGEPEIERVSMAHRKRNGCAEKCRIADECICGFRERAGKPAPSCYPSPELRCVFCRCMSFRRTCLLFNVGREPDFRPFAHLGEKPAPFDWESHYLSEFGPEMAAQYRRAAGLDKPERPKSCVESIDERETSDLLSSQTGRLRRIE